MAGFTGGCLCGAIRYEAKSDAVRMVNCHCDDCRRVTGASFATNVFVKADDLEVTQGTPGIYKHFAESGNRRVKEFCRDCGSQLFSYGDGRPGLKSVKVGTIDDADFVKPTANLYASKALPFTYIDENLDNFEKMPDK